MKSQIEKRLADLKAEHEAGQKMLAELDAKRAGLVQTMLRIEGAMQVLQELLPSDEANNATVTNLPHAAR
ncbi:hypothetical protein SAMN05443572_103355 [Myxococcus fulvus]|uniref:Uncharacterized protein n=1 Tax=Myxococcus fulvus TaxID=33 RepID=A0A511T8I9_MYXFU|nr:MULTISPECIES: hypothetical protein [Myxococcus]AKF86234.1 hypothetical protein MFUL124B02_23465 [Myxococcus fulvus 124B02]MCP3060339.1 hypothetical protein [Myxococcus guangdongensis]GEN10475.1 hypothetical protein MFU01_55120 [Myxococcus fulvus]SET81778.1 hypothetical protein SAMN05443572_103355 [Myxococcus fulvus]